MSGVLTYGNGLRAEAGFLPTPAFAMASKQLGIDPEREEPMEIIWGNGIAPLNAKWMGCSAEGAFAHLVHIIRDQPTAGKLRCPYTRTLSVGHLLGSTGDADVRDALHRRAVFYGAAFQMVGDRVTSPVYDELPGVYLHAMAYDNLVTFGRDYKRAHRELGADKASATFAGAPRFMPVKIRLLRKAGRTAEAATLTVTCSVNTPDWRRLCQQANETAAGRPQR